MVSFDPARGAQPHAAVYANQLSDGLRKAKFMHIERAFAQPQLLQYGTQTTPVTVPTFPTAVQDNVVAIRIPGAVGCDYIEMYQTTAQTLMPAIDASKGVEIALDQVDNESVEYVPGGNRASNPLGYLVGTDKAVFIHAVLEIPDANGIDQMLVGWRKQENFVVPTSIANGGDPLYTDLAGIGFAGTVADPNPLRTFSDLNNSGSGVATAVGYTIPDNRIFSLTTMVKGRRVSYKVNGKLLGTGPIAVDGIGAAIAAQTPVTSPTFNFDAGDFLVPFIFVRQDALLSPLYLRSLTIGQLSEDGFEDGARGPV